MLVLLGAVLGGGLSGCTDDPQNADTKQIRQETADVLEMTARGADAETLQTAQSKVQSTLVRHSQAGGLTKDAALLASGNLALARGRNLQSDLNLKLLPVRNSVYAFEQTLRTAEDLLLEKERIEGILAQGQQEMTELEQALNGTAEQAGLKQQIEAAQAALNDLQQQKQQTQAKKDKTQSVLDDYQSRADDLLRQAELAGGDKKLQLQKEAYALLKDRKSHYIEAQAFEDQITALDDQIELAQSQVDNLTQSIDQTQQRIQAISTSETRIGLQQQLREVGQSLALQQQQLAEAAKAIGTALQTYRTEAQNVSTVFEETISEFERVRAREAAFTASLQMAEAYHQAALAHTAAIRLQIDTAYRLDDLLATTDPAFADLLRGQITVSSEIDLERAEMVMGLYDKAIEAYQQAFDAAGAIGQEAQCDVLKSQLLAVDSKMRLADALNMPTVAEQADAKRQELMQKGQEYGVSFTQSETRKLIEFGLDYTPSLPVNLEVLAEELETRFSAWKRLPLAQQEAAVEANLTQITELIDRYGETLAQRLEPLRQEMLNAQQRGFEAPVGGAGGAADPNSF